jgi:hypothetical protein
VKCRRPIPRKSIAAESAYRKAYAVDINVEAWRQTSTCTAREDNGIGNNEYDDHSSNDMAKGVAGKRFPEKGHESQA